MEIYFNVMKNILYPLLYLLNIAKEVVFVGFFVTVAGGSRSVLQYFNSFSSAVSSQFLTKSTFVNLNNLSFIFFILGYIMPFVFNCSTNNTIWYNKIGKSEFL